MIASAKRYMTAFAAAALTAVAVSACGGGNGPTNGPPMHTYVDVDLSDLMSGFTATAGTLQIDAGEYVDRGTIRFSCDDDGDDCTVMVAVDANGTITARYRSPGGIVTASDVPDTPPNGKEDVDLSDVTVGFLADAIMMLEIDAGESKSHGEISFSCAAGGENCVVMVMVGSDGTITAMSSGGDVTASDAGEPNLIVDQRLDAAIRRGSYVPWPPVDFDTGAPGTGSGFMEMTNSDFAGIDGWDDTAYRRENPVSGMTRASSETYVIYSNTDFEMAVPFEDEYPFDRDDDGDAEYDSRWIISSDWPNIGGGNLPSAMMQGDRVSSRMLDGAPGTYICVELNGCTIQSDADGNIVGIMGEIWFLPDEGAMVDVPNPEYFYFGYWINESTDDEDDPVFDVAAIYGGVEPSLHSDLLMLEGSATYAGPATGLYVRRWTDSVSGDVLRRRTGQFTADAMLMADFGGADIAASAQFMIEGTISNFTDAERGVDLGWQLALESADFGPGLATAWFLGDTEGGGDDTGSWWGEFFGPVSYDDLLTPDDETVYPSGVAGGFEGDFANGDVVGAYGAERQ